MIKFRSDAFRWAVQTLRDCQFSENQLEILNSDNFVMNVVPTVLTAVEWQEVLREVNREQGATVQVIQFDGANA